MTQTQRTIAALVLLFVVAGSAYAYLEWIDRPAPDPVVSQEPTTHATSTEPEQTPEPELLYSNHGFGTVSLRLNEAASLPNDLSMRVTSILEDSRCPENARCVWAGQIRLAVNVRSASGLSRNEFTLGSTVTTEAEEVTLLNVTPGKLAGQELSDDDYRFIFEVKERTAPTGQCYVGGCSAQLCTDDPNAVSTCEYRSEYACYKQATCERQDNGKCGWTETKELRSCLRNPPEE